ncbi:MAG: hypothetical protein JNM86_00905 [Phycisphaerae bacterium]|nr:hypothetical protein [Phycisphaerae bacterium]MBN8598011.1 hypothetical protein [Planctomycetota bacterium]
MSAAPSASNPPELREPKVRAEEEIPEPGMAVSEISGGEAEPDEADGEDAGPVGGATLSFRERVEEFIGRLSTRNNFWHRVCSLIWLPYAFKSGIRMKRVDAETFTAELPYRRFNKNWYNAMAGAALLANSEIAGGMYIFGITGGEFTIVCKELTYKFLRPCYGPALYHVVPREDLKALVESGKEFNLTLELEIVQQAVIPQAIGDRSKDKRSIVARMAAKQRKVGQCQATFHVTPNRHNKSKRGSARNVGQREA